MCLTCSLLYITRLTQGVPAPYAEMFVQCQLHAERQANKQEQSRRFELVIKALRSQKADREAEAARVAHFQVLD